QASAGIVARGFWFDVEKVLAQEDVLVAIPIIIRNTHCESGAQLGLHRKDPDFEMALSINKDARLEPAGFPQARALRKNIQHVVDARFGPSLIRWESFDQKGDRLGDAVDTAQGH